MRYKHIFFDLDHTLWDYNTNAKASLAEIYDSLDLPMAGVGPFQEFFDQFNQANYYLWDRYDRGQIDRSRLLGHRFVMVLECFGVTNPVLSKQISEAYSALCPTKTALLPFAREALDYLHAHYPLSIISNGFSTVQQTKLRGAKIDHFFKSVTTSDASGFRKPMRQIFEQAAAGVGLQTTESVMIGDSLTADVQGAMGAAMAAVYYNPQKTTHNTDVPFEIACLSQLMNLF